MNRIRQKREACVTQLVERRRWESLVSCFAFRSRRFALSPSCPRSDEESTIIFCDWHMFITSVIDLIQVGCQIGKRWIHQPFRNKLTLQAAFRNAKRWRMLWRPYWGKSTQNWPHLKKKRKRLVSALRERMLWIAVAKTVTTRWTKTANIFGIAMVAKIWFALTACANVTTVSHLCAKTARVHVRCHPGAKTAANPCALTVERNAKTAEEWHAQTASKPLDLTIVNIAPDAGITSIMIVRWAHFETQSINVHSKTSQNVLQQVSWLSHSENL